jgi:hypothetical protein
MEVSISKWSGASLLVLRPCLFLGLAACAGEEGAAGGAVEPVAPDEAQADSTSAGDSELDRLRSLGYVEVSEEAYDEQESGVLHHQPKLSAPGYNLYTNRYRCSVVLMDNAGRELRRWARPGDRSWSNAQLLENGDLLVIGQEASDERAGVLDEHRYLLRLTWAGEERWRVPVNAHHDLELTPDGRIAVLSFRRNREPGLKEGLELREDTVELFDLEGRKLEERSLVEVLRSKPELYTMQRVQPTQEGDLRYVDLIHSNSVEFLTQPQAAAPNELFAPGNVLVCMRHQCALIIFNWETGELLWTWGHGEILGPHDATLLDNGHILLFDNGLGRGWSRVIELDPLKREIVWEYRGDPPKSFYSASRGSNQRLPNGNTLIAESDVSRAFEVTPEGKLVWAWVNPERDDKGHLVTIVRMKRLPEAFIEAFLSKE